MPDRIISKEGYEILMRELKELRDVKRPSIIKRIESAKELGDLSENAEYQDAKEELSLVDTRIGELLEMVSDIEVVDKSEGAAVGMGSIVVVKVGKGERTFTIVGASEADPINGKISNESPIGRGLMGRHAGDEVSVDTPSGTAVYHIVSVA